MYIFSGYTIKERLTLLDLHYSEKLERDIREKMEAKRREQAGRIRESLMARNPVWRALRSAARCVYFFCSNKAAIFIPCLIQYCTILKSSDYLYCCNEFVYNFQLLGTNTKEILAFELRFVGMRHVNRQNGIGCKWK